MRTHGDPHERLLALVSAAGAEVLRAKADDTYHGDNHADSVGLYAKLVELAERNGDRAAESDNRFWLGTALHGSGRLVEAAAAMAPALEHGSFSGGRVLQNRLLTRYVLVAVDIPLPLAEIERAMAQIEQLHHTWRWQDRESRLPMARSRLALLRGHRHRALRWARLAMTRFPRDPSAYASHAYLVTFFRACMACERLDLLRDCMDRWRHSNDPYFRTNRRMVENMIGAELALADGDTERVLSLSRLVEEGAWLTQDHVYRNGGLAERVSLALAAGRPDLARPILPHLLRSRGCEVGWDRFHYRLLLGDYHLAEARVRLADGAAGRDAARQRLDAAMCCYRRAALAGRELDTRLRCRGNGNRVKRRLAAVAEVADEV